MVAQGIFVQIFPYRITILFVFCDNLHSLDDACLFLHLCKDAHVINDHCSPICFNLFEEVYSTVCGHSFWYTCSLLIISCYPLPDPTSPPPSSYRCVRRMLVQSPHCPICKAGLPPQNSIHPNFSCKCEDDLCLFIV